MPETVPSNPIIGGEVSKTRTYGDLVTSIIHPSYAISDTVVPSRRWEMETSPMPAVNDAMTVRQMLDIVTSLQPHYRMIEPVDPHLRYIP